MRQHEHHSNGVWTVEDQERDTLHCSLPMGFLSPGSSCLERIRFVGSSSAIALAPPSILDPHSISSFFQHPHTSLLPPTLISSAETATSTFFQAIHSLSTSNSAASTATSAGLLATDTNVDSASVEQLKVLLEEESLSNLGHDILIFLAAAVVAEPLGKILNVTPVLLYLLFGAVAGPYGLSIFTSGTEVNSEIGDYGILFLLFVEGLNLSPERLKALGSFFSLGATQLLLSVGLIFFGLFFGGPYLLPIFQDVRVPIDPSVITDLFQGPVVAFSIAAAGALSSSAFVLPILKEKVGYCTKVAHYIV